MQDVILVIVIVVVRTTTIVRTREGERPLLVEMYLKDGIENQQCRITIVTLYVQVVQVGSAVDVLLEVFVLIALPGPESEVLGIEHEATELAEVEFRVCLDAETAAHIVVALNDVEMVTLGATEQDATQEDALFQLRQDTHLWQ